MHRSHFHLPRLSLLFFSLLSTVSGDGLSDAQVNLVKQRLQEGATHSWEIGTRAQTLTELSAPSFSVLTPSITLPPASSLNTSNNASLADVFAITRSVVAALPCSPCTGVSQPFFSGDGSAGDPASVGVAVLLANWTGLPGEDYGDAATAQINYLFSSAVPKTTDGAISHRVSTLELWSDSVYMVPPFLAYYGVTTSNTSMMQQAYLQIKLYRNYLSDRGENGLWRHVALGSNGSDTGHWSTGNGWAAAGMLRVLGTLKSSQFSGTFTKQIKDLGNWVAEIHGAMYPHLQSNGLFVNYADGNSDNNFDDASSSALLAATVYRLAILTGNTKFISQAEITRAALFTTNSTAAATFSPSASLTTTSTAQSSSSPSSSSTSSTSSSPSPSPFAGMSHFTSDGWLQPVVDPNNIGAQGSDSPEGEAFVLMLQSAWRDWTAAGSPGATNSAQPSSGRARGIRDPLTVLAMVGLVVACTFGDHLFA